jgi:hypothetical protein
MAKPRIFTASLDEAQLRQVLNTFQSELNIIFLESETRVVLAPLGDFLGPKITLPPVRWLTGRAFGSNLEIRWHLEGSQFEAVALTESERGPQDWQPSGWNLKLDESTRQRNVLLMGVNIRNLSADHILYGAQPQGGLWIDERIPRPLNYPEIDRQAERVMLKCIDYLSRGLVVVSRLSGLAAYKDLQR